jgi:hypothetical protein
MPVYSKDRINLFKTEFLGWIGDRPIIACWKYNDYLWFFWCPACRKRHYHRPASGLVRSDCKAFTSGYFIRLHSSQIHIPYS